MMPSQPPPPPSADTSAVDAENPWPGLASFREADRDFFFGRERETEELVRLVTRERLTVLFGLSGLGKTSLLQAGAFPRLREENVLPVLIRLDHSEGSPSCTAQILAALARAAAAAGAEIPAARPGETLWEYFHRQGNDFWSARNRPLTPLLAFDQFEEIFTLAKGRPSSADLIDTLASMAEGYPPAAVRARLDANPAEARNFSFGRHPYKILLSLREDFLPDLEALRDRLRTIGNNRLRVHRMDGENALRVVTLPAPDLLDADVADRVVRFVAGKDAADDTAPLAAMEVEPALLSIVCRELNNKRRARGEPKITAGLLEGSRTEILTDLYERSLADLAPEVRNFIEERLLTVSGFRDSVALENALATPGVTREAVDRLTERRLLRIEDRGGGQRLELTHDVLTGVVRQSRDTRRQREEQEQAEMARQAAEAREREVRRKLRRSRQVLAVFAVLLVGVAILSVYAHFLEQTAKKTLAVSDVERALNLERDESQQALACLAQALRQDPDNLGARALLFDILLNRSWLLPVREALHPDTSYIEISRDGRTLAVLTKAGEILLHDAGTGRPLAPPLRNASPISDLQFSRDSGRLATVSNTETRIWDARTGREIGGPIGNRDGPVACLDAGCNLVQQGLGATTRFLRTSTGQPVGPPFPTAALRSQLTPDGIRIVTMAPDGAAWTLQVRDLRTGESVGAPIPQPQPVRRAELSPDGRLLLVGSGLDVQVWDAETRNRVSTLSHETAVDDAVMSPDSKLLVTHTVGGMTRVWEPRGGKVLFSVHFDSDWWTAQMSPDDKVLVLVTEDRTLRLWDLASGALLYEPVQDVSAAQLQNGQTTRVVTASEDGVVRVLSPSGAARTVLLDTPTDVFDSAALSSDAGLVATTESGTLSVHDTTTLKLAGPPLRNLGPAVRLRFVDHDRKVAAVLKDRAFTWDYRAGRIVAQVALQPYWQIFDDISPDGAKAVLVTSPALPPVLQVVDLATGRPLTGLLEHKARWKIPIPFSRDGRRILFAPTESSLQVIDLATGKVQSTLASQAARLLSAVFSPDGHRILTARDDRTARIWDADTGQLLRSFTGQHGLASAAFSADGRFVLTVAEDTRVRMWNAADGKLQGEPLLTPSVRSARLAPDGQRILVLAETTARLWDSVTGRALGNPIVPGGRIFDARFTADGHRFVVASEETVSVSDIPLGAARDAGLLVRWATAVSGYKLEDNGIMVSLPDTRPRLEALRRETASAPPGQPGTPSLIRWFLTDPAKRPPSPLSP